MTHVLAYLPPLESDYAKARLAEVLTDYAAGRLGVELRSENFAYGDGGVSVAEVAKNLVPGDVVLVRNLGDISHRPSVQEKTVFDLLKRGVDLHVYTLNGPIDQHLPIFREAWAAVRPIELEVDQLKARLELTEAQHAEDMKTFEQEVVKQAVKKFGVTALLKEEPSDAAKVGKWIEAQRKARGMTLQQLGDAVGISKQSVDRIETSGRGDALPAILTYFSNGGTQPQEARQ